MWCMRVQGAVGVVRGRRGSGCVEGWESSGCLGW